MILCLSNARSGDHILILDVVSFQCDFKLIRYALTISAWNYNKNGLCLALALTVFIIYLVKAVSI